MASLGSMRILQVCSSLAWGGTEMHVPILSKKLQSRGHEVCIISNPAGTIYGHSKDLSIPSQAIPIGAYINPYSTYKLNRFIDCFEPDIIHLHLSRDLWQTVPATLLSKFDGPMVLTKHVGSYVKKNDFLHRWLYSRISKIITVSETLNKNVSETCPILPNQVVTIHPGADLDRFDRANYDRVNTRKLLGISPDTRLIGTVGRISPGKGYEDLLLAAQKLRGQNLDQEIQFLIVGAASYGEEEYQKSIIKISHELGLRETVIFTGFRDDIPALLSALDIFIFPSRAEGFGATVIEAMAMGIACVSTRSDGTLDTVVDGKTSLVFKAGDIDRLTESIELLLTNNSLRERISENGYNQVKERFNLDVMTDHVEDLYISLSSS